MHVTPYHKKKQWQRFFFGAFVGGIVAYCIVIFMYGSMYEKLLNKTYELQAQVTELKNQNEALLQDKEDIDEKNKERLTINNIETHITNADELKLDRLSISQLDEMIKREINYIIGKDIDSISESEQLLQSTIENKQFSVDDLTYYFEVEKLIISKTVKLILIGKL